jgi:hypothetical protein
MGDDFESEHMAPTSAVRHRDKRVSRGMAALLGIWAPFCWVLAAVIGYANAGSANPVPAAVLPVVLAAIAALGVMFAVMALTFSVLRTVVTDREVIIKYGLWGPSIELSSITSVHVKPYDWSRYGGWGIRRGIGGGWAYVPGPGDVVVIEYDDAGSSKRVEVGAENAAALAEQIERSRNGTAKLRLAESGTGSAAQTEEDLHADVEAELEAEAAEDATAETSTAR